MWRTVGASPILTPGDHLAKLCGSSHHPACAALCWSRRRQRGHVALGGHGPRLLSSDRARPSGRGLSQPRPGCIVDLAPLAWRCAGHLVSALVSLGAEYLARDGVLLGLVGQAKRAPSAAASPSA